MHASVDEPSNDERKFWFLATMTQITDSQFSDFFGRMSIEDVFRFADMDGSGDLDIFEMGGALRMMGMRVGIFSLFFSSFSEVLFRYCLSFF